MRGSFSSQSKHVGSTSSDGGFPVRIHRPDGSERERSGSPVLDRSMPIKSPIAKTALETEKNIDTIYLKYGRPLDLRYAYKVHGAALSPSWLVVSLLVLCVCVCVIRSQD